jgi:serine/threonine-protein kinase HipA
MIRKCLYCYRAIDKSLESDFHEKCSLDFFEMKQAPLLTYSFNQMTELAKNVVERSIAVPGVQPKLSLSLLKKNLANGSTDRLTVVGALGGNYILKPPSVDYKEMPQNEHVTMRIAESFGIRTVKSSLIRLHSGELAYISKRIDRTSKGEKIHMIDMFQILEAFDKYKSSMEKVGQALHNYSSNTLLDKLFFFELSIFSYLTGNNDMHLKNFSMINTGDKWELSPAYDLLNVNIINASDTEELALSLEGKKKRLRKDHFERFGKGLNLNDKQIENTFKRFINNKSKAIQWIDDSFLSSHFKGKYKATLEQRYKVLSR